MILDKFLLLSEPVSSSVEQDRLNSLYRAPTSLSVCASCNLVSGKEKEEGIQMGHCITLGPWRPG